MNYILQSNTSSCELITLLNAYYHNNKEYYKYPYIFNSISFNDKSETFKEFHKIFKKAPALVYDKLNIAERIEYIGTDKNFKKWVDSNLKKGNLIDFGGYIREPHSFLIAEYDKKMDSYMCINARIFTNNNAVEWLPFPLLLKIYKKNEKYNNKSFNKLNITKLHLTSGVIKFK